MKKAPYSYAEAQQIISEYQYLIGQPFQKDNNTLISSIVIAPYDQLNKKRFMVYYLLFNDAEKALSHEYKGLLFDILVVAGSYSEQLFHEDIYTWFSNNKLSALDHSELGVDSLISKNLG